MAEVRRASPIQIATGERLFSRFDYRELLTAGGASVIQPDVVHAGGIAETLAIAAMAETWMVPVAPHNPNGPVATAATLVVDAIAPNALIQEMLTPWMPTGAMPSSKGSPRVVDGHLAIPDRPGLGVRLVPEEMPATPTSRWTSTSSGPRRCSRPSTSAASARSGTVPASPPQPRREWRSPCPSSRKLPQPPDRKPRGADVIGLLHGGISVSDMDASLAFYHEGLGLPVVVDAIRNTPYLHEALDLPFSELRYVLLGIPGAPGTRSSCSSTGGSNASRRPLGRATRVGTRLPPGARRGGRLQADGEPWLSGALGGVVDIDSGVNAGGGSRMSPTLTGSG